MDKQQHNNIDCVSILIKQLAASKTIMSTSFHLLCEWVRVVWLYSKRLCCLFYDEPDSSTLHSTFAFFFFLQSFTLRMEARRSYICYRVSTSMLIYSRGNCVGFVLRHNNSNHRYTKWKCLTNTKQNTWWMPIIIMIIAQMASRPLDSWLKHAN